MSAFPLPSSCARQSDAFSLLHPAIQRWIWTESWSELRDVQERAITALSGEHGDVILAAATAAGKTEAAFLPLLTNLLAAAPLPGVIVYVSPLKALINDQFGRLEQLCGALDIAVWPWHGDIGATRKTQFLKKPSGVLLITPESLEALLCNRGSAIPVVFKNLQAIVVDELHAFMGEERGKQLQSLLQRVDAATGRANPRVGLSATLGDMRLAAEFLRPGAGAAVRIIESRSDGGKIAVLVKGYIEPAPASKSRSKPTGDDDAGTDDDDDSEGAAQAQIVEHLFKHLRGTNNLIFPNTRNKVESIAYRLRKRSEKERVPNEFWPHHGSLSRELREEAEAALKSGQAPATAVCTATLELGIDIGSVKSIAQLGCPPSVASLRQRLGRSGRRKGDPSILRGYCIEPGLTHGMHPIDELRADLVQLTAMVSLLLEGWFEPPPTGGLHYSTLVQQLLALIAQRGGITAAGAYKLLCTHGPFDGLSPAAFADLLRHLGKQDLLQQESSGLLLHGKKGERHVNHYSFYAAFATEEEYRLISDGRTLGAVPISNALSLGDLLLFGGRTWQIQQIEEASRTVTVIRHNGGHAPRFSSDAGFVHEGVRRRMRQLYESDAPVPFLDATAAQLLEEGRQAYRRYALASSDFLERGLSTVVFTWLGDAANHALVMALKQVGLSAVAEGPAVEVANGHLDAAQLRAVLRKLGAAPPPVATALLADTQNLAQEKWDWALPPEALKLSYASLKLDIAGAWRWLSCLT